MRGIVSITVAGAVRGDAHCPSAVLGMGNHCWCLRGDFRVHDGHLGLGTRWDPGMGIQQGWGWGRIFPGVLAERELYLLAGVRWFTHVDFYFCGS